MLVLANTLASFRVACAYVASGNEDKRHRLAFTALRSLVGPRPHSWRSDVGAPRGRKTMSDRRKREIRKLMAETGMNYTRAAREVERRRSPDASSVPDFIGAGRQIAEIQRAVQEHARLAASIGDLGPAGRQIAEIQRGVQDHVQANRGDPAPSPTSQRV